MKVFVLSGSNENCYEVFGGFSTKEKAIENKEKLEQSTNIVHNKIKLNVDEIEVDDDSTVNFFLNE